MKILVTGGTGHLGANLVRRLLETGSQVRVLMQPGVSGAALDELEVERFEGDLRDPERTFMAVRGCERVYHCAAKISTRHAEERDIYDYNVLGTRHLLKAAARTGVGRVVVTGSFSTVGHRPDRPSIEDDPFYPFEKTMPYEVSKVFAEHECWHAAAAGLDVVVAISCGIVGPNDFRPSRMGQVLIDFAHGKLRAYVPGGFEFVSVRDIVEGHVLAMEKGRSGQRYIFSTEFVSMDDLMGIFERVTGRRRPLLRMPLPLMAGVARVNSFVLNRFFPRVPQRLTPGAIRILGLNRRADCTKARTELGYQPTSVTGAIEEAYNWFVERNMIRRGRPAGMEHAKQISS